MSRQRIPISAGQELTVTLTQGQVRIFHSYPHDGIPMEDPVSIGVETVPQLITALRRAYNEHNGVDTTSFNQHTDGTEATVVLQHILNAGSQTTTPEA